MASHEENEVDATATAGDIQAAAGDAASQTLDAGTGQGVELSDAAIQVKASPLPGAEGSRIHIGS